MKTLVLSTILILNLCGLTFAQSETRGLRGDPAAIADAEAMVATMGGIDIWSQLKSIHFVHQWYPWNRTDSYVENEILDLTDSRSWVERKNEIFHKLRAYSPEGKYWSVTDGKFEYGSEEIFDNAMKRAPFNFYRLVRAIAIGDPFYEVRFGNGDIPQTRQLEFYGPDGVLRGWIILNARKEPLVKATTEYRYTFGPMKQFGNLRMPAWGVYGNGSTMFEMISVEGANQPPDSSLFSSPSEFENQ